MSVTRVVLLLGALALAAAPSLPAQTNIEIAGAVGEKGYILDEVVGRTDAVILVRATTRPPAGRGQQRLLALHLKDPTDPLFEPGDVDDQNGTIRFAFMSELVKIAAVRAMFEPRSFLLQRCGAGSWYAEKPQGLDFVYHYLLGYTFPERDRGVEPAVLLQRLRNVAPKAELIQRPGLRASQQCQLHKGLQLEDSVVHKQRLANVAAICVDRYRTGTFGQTRGAPLSEAEAVAHCPGASVKDKPLEAYGVEDATLVASEPDLDLYLSHDRTPAFYVAIHKLAPDEPIDIYAQHPDGSYQISPAFHQRLLGWGVFPELSEGQSRSRTSMWHFIEGFAHPSGARYPVIATTHSRYAQSGPVSYPAFTRFSLPPLSASAVTRAARPPTATQLARVEQLPGREPETVTHAIHREPSWPAPDSRRFPRAVNLLGAGPSANLSRNLQSSVAMQTSISRILAGLYFKDCKMDDELCRSAYCSRKYKRVITDAGSESRAAVVRGLQAMDPVSEQVEGGPWPIGNVLVRLGCLDFALDYLRATDDPGDAPFEETYEQARNIIVANALMGDRGELDAGDVVAFSLGFSFGKATLGDARAFAPQADNSKLNYERLVESYEQFYDEREITERLNFPPNQPVFVAADFEPTRAFTSGGQSFTFADVLEIYIRRANIDARDRFNLPMTASPIAFYDDADNVYVAGHDPVSRLFAIDVYTAADASLKVGGKPASPFLAGARLFPAIANGVVRMEAQEKARR